MGESIRRLTLTEKTKALILLHSAVLLWGFTAILGKLISIGALPLVWHRLWITCTILLFFKSCRKGLKILKIREILIFLLIGLLVSAHWICFYGAIKLSSASVALSAIGTSALIASIIEPLIFKVKIRIRQVFTGLISLTGILIIFNALNKMDSLGMLVGIFGAALAALFSSLNKKFIGNHSAATISFLEFVAGIVAIFPFMLWTSGKNWLPSHLDLLWLFLLGGGCTALPFVISLKALRHLSAFTSNLNVNLEPIYGMILAALIFEEYKILNPEFYIGASIILITALSAPVLEFARTKKENVN